MKGMLSENDVPLIDIKNLNKCLNCEKPKCANCIYQEGYGKRYYERNKELCKKRSLEYYHKKKEMLRQRRV